MDDREYKRMLWSCQCGHVARSAAAEARHRHNFPILCKKPKPTGRDVTGPSGTHLPRKVVSMTPQRRNYAEARIKRLKSKLRVLGELKQDDPKNRGVQRQINSAKASLKRWQKEIWESGT